MLDALKYLRKKYLQKEQIFTKETSINERNKYLRKKQIFTKETNIYERNILRNI